MGHTVWSGRIVTDLILSELKEYAKVLNKSDQETYLRILKRPLKRVGAISNASSMHTWAFLLISMIVEQEKKIEYLEDVVNGRVSGK